MNPPQRSDTARPSPHRFALSTKKRINKAASDQSVQGHVTQDSSSNAPSSTPRVSRPRFARPSTPRSTASAATPKPRFSVASSTQCDDVQDFQSSGEVDDVNRDVANEHITPSIESVLHGGPANVHPSPPRVKRRKLDPEPSTNHFDTPRYDQHLPASKNFILPPTPESSIPSPQPTTKPSFLRSSFPSQTLIDPLPEIFSPHKRGQRFVPGGMAAELQSWIVDTGTAALQSRRPAEHGVADYAIRCEVMEVHDRDDMLLVRGAMTNGRERQVMLVDDDKGGSKKNISVGDMVGIKAPTWEVDLAGETYVVGVDWSILA